MMSTFPLRPTQEYPSLVQISTFSVHIHVVLAPSLTLIQTYYFSMCLSVGLPDVYMTKNLDLHYAGILTDPDIWTSLYSVVILTLAMETVCCSITSWIEVLSASIILSNSSMQQTPLSANTSAPPSERIIKTVRWGRIFAKELPYSIMVFSNNIWFSLSWIIVLLGCPE